jgi:ABC-type multidrug transport system permease subunit
VRRRVARRIGQLVVFSLVALTLLGLDLQAGLMAGTIQLGLVLVLHAISGVVTGAALFALVKRAEAFFSLTYLILITFATLGGAIVASPQLPTWSRAVGRLTPHHWSMRALDEITLGAGRWSVVVTSSAVLLLLIIALAVVAVAKLDLRQERYADA